MDEKTIPVVLKTALPLVKLLAGEYIRSKPSPMEEMLDKIVEKINPEKILEEEINTLLAED